MILDSSYVKVKLICNACCNLYSWNLYLKIIFQNKNQTSIYLNISEYLDLPRRKRPVVDSFCVLNPPQYTTGKLGGNDAICCHVSKALRLRARGLSSSMFVFTTWNENPGDSTPFSWNVYVGCQGYIKHSLQFTLKVVQKTIRHAY